MQLHHKLLILIYPFIYLKEIVKNYLVPVNSNKIRVLLYHDIPLDKFDHLFDNLSKLKKKWNFITPKEFEDHISGINILKGKNPYPLTDKSKYKAQMDDIIKLSVKNIYKSREVIEKELTGYQIINTLLDKFITAFNNNYEGTASNFDSLVLQLLPEKFRVEKDNLYDRLLHICHFISLLTDGNAYILFNTINASKN